LIERAHGNQQGGDVEGARRLYREMTARALGSLDASICARVCRSGTADGFAGEVIEACEAAVEPGEGDPEAMRVRGIARALTGDLLGAFEDLSTYLETEPAKYLSDANRAALRRLVDSLERLQAPPALELRAALEEGSGGSRFGGRVLRRGTRGELSD
jgi:hypothetical protein